jgi:ferredoxin-NADP reductase
MRPQLSRAQHLASRSTRCTPTKTIPRRSFAQTTRRRTTPHYEPPAPKDSKGNDARLSRFSKILGIAVGSAFAFGYSVYKHKNKTAAENAGAGGGGVGPGQDGFVKYRLAAREDVSSTCAIFTLRPVLGGKGIGGGSGEEEGKGKRAIQSVLFKQPQLQIARAYTLLPRELGQADDELRFLIRREKGGEVSGYLHRLEAGAEVEVRGPHAEYTFPEGEKVGKVVFLAGGTGIAPALQAARAVAGEADVHILWANRQREDCEGGKSDTVSEAGGSWGEMFSGWFSAFGTPGKDAKVQDAAVEKRPKSEIVRRLEALKRDGQGRVAIDYFVDSEERFIKPVEATTLVRTSFSLDAKPEGKNIMFVSGPEGFVNAWAGPKVWQNGEELQGPLGGALAKLDLKDWEIVKL